MRRWRFDGPDEITGSMVDGRTGGMVAWFRMTEIRRVFKGEKARKVYDGYRAYAWSKEKNFSKPFKTAEAAKRAVERWLEKQKRRIPATSEFVVTRVGVKLKARRK